MIKKSVIKGIPISKQEKKEMMEGKIKQGLLANLTRSLSLRKRELSLSPTKPGAIQLGKLTLNPENDTEKKLQGESIHKIDYEESEHLSSFRDDLEASKPAAAANSSDKIVPNLRLSNLAPPP